LEEIEIEVRDIEKEYQGVSPEEKP